MDSSPAATALRSLARELAPNRPWTALLEAACTLFSERDAERRILLQLMEMSIAETEEDRAGAMEDLVADAELAFEEMMPPMEEEFTAKVHGTYRVVNGSVG